MAMKPPKRMFPGRERPEPGSFGPESLQQWVQNFPDHWRSAYRSALKLEYGPDIVISATPHNDRANTAPQGFMPMTRAEASRTLPSLAVSLMRPADAGYFYLIPTKRFGRMKGSYLAMLPKPTDNEELPLVAITQGESGVGVFVD